MRTGDKFITSKIRRAGSSLREGVSWSEELRKVCVLNLDKFFSSVCIEMMMNPASLEAESSVVRADAPRQGKPTHRGEPKEQARICYAARARKNKAEATRSKAATDAEADAGRDNCVSRPGSGGEFLGNFAAIREALACAGGHVAAVERILEQKRLVAAAAAGKRPTAEEHLAEASELRRRNKDVSRINPSDPAGPPNINAGSALRPPPAYLPPRHRTRPRLNSRAAAERSWGH
jgi:hypothetical protein